MSNPFNGTNGTTACPPPFLDPHNFPKNGGCKSQNPVNIRQASN